MTVSLSRIPPPRVAALSSVPDSTEVWPAVLGLPCPVVIIVMVAVAHSVVVRVLALVPPAALLPPAGIWLMAWSELLRRHCSLWRPGAAAAAATAAAAGAMVGALLPAACQMLAGNLQGLAGFAHLLAPQWQIRDLQAQP